MSSVNSCPPHIEDHDKLFKNAEILKPEYGVSGFLPTQDPLSEFSEQSPYHCLDQIGRDLPSLLCDKHFRQYANKLKIPKWQGSASHDELPSLRLYYLRVGFLASAYINQVNAPSCNELPANISIPLVHACQLLQRPPILSYDGYALYNWRRFQKHRPIQLGNIDTIQNFVHLYDEHWFILIHVEIEAIAAQILAAISSIYRMMLDRCESSIDYELWQIASAVERQVKVLKRIPEHMDPELYFKTFRPYIRFFEHVVYQGIKRQALNFRGETGAQSSIMPLLVAFLKIPHQSSILTRHLLDMRQYMPAKHRLLIQQIELMPSIRHPDYRDSFNAILDHIVEFRKVHLGWAHDYINKHVKDPRGTGGTPYMQWLDQLLNETEAHKIMD